MDNTLELDDELPVSQKTDSNGAFWVALGVFLSRISGFVRESVTAYYFGARSPVADAFKGALRIPNFLQNLFGEGVLSASFIPVYAGLRAQGREIEAQETASAVAVLLSLITSLLTCLGMIFAPLLIDIIVPGFNGETRELAVLLVRIFFPGTATLVLSAWCLGILNSHRRFFLSYAAPVLWNLTIICVLLVFGPHREKSQLAVITAWGVVLGSVLQFLVQLPQALRLLGRFKLLLGFNILSLREVVKNFIPVVFSRGVVQISAYIDSIIASFLQVGSVAAIGYAQILYLVPISLFGVPISAAELPAMSSVQGNNKEVRAYLQQKLVAGLRQIAFFVVPSELAFIILGDVVVAALYQSGEFTRADTLYVWLTLAGLGTGLTASAMARLYSAAFFALRDTRTPLKAAILRVLLTTCLGATGALLAPSFLGVDQWWAIFGLTVATGIGSTVEYFFLRAKLQLRIGTVILGENFLTKLWAGALFSALLAFGLKSVLLDVRPLLLAFIVLGVYGILYLVSCWFFGVEEAARLARKVKLFPK